MVFPDEDNGDDVGIKTRSGKKLSVCQSSEIQSTSNATSLQAICTLKTWKRSTLCFNECTQNRCDPLAKFFRYNRTRTCRRCVIVRKLLLNELILIYDKDELENTLMNYLYFHAIKVFDSDAEQHYANGRAHHPYFVGYSQFREFKSLLVRNIVSCFNLPVAMQSAALRPFIFRSNLWSKAEIDEIGRSVLCDLCTEEDASGERRELDHKFWWPRVLVTLGGKRYLRRGFQFVHNETDISEPQQFLFCQIHFRFFNCFYKLTHMDWNVHLNFRQRIAQQFEQNAGMDAEQLINGIEPTIFSRLLNAYIPIIRYLNTDFDTFRAFNGRVAWVHFSIALKNEAIFKKVSGMACGGS